ncbi:beta1,4 mannosyltransferase, putative [Talaromyces stipitatus ATCC 10500]|uniref:Chitobiosyldiphosphodolichol beta-mannosyltransferase n=1 Tax=Talaromyces stipitatus (strain ATCC 10500 / CBS 375.48 / QM 6759 / NRRL 1006) TaxID=441959 RepID=B8MMR3_TALSN|nr:beta1,4 mannosyltransferase, putative [Talaromyces stipitatus ATCC 10500]EED13819.1 beta1,4 mannosyltransferase, putative [Talaromyces stipitatus ATCC 10500]
MSNCAFRLTNATARTLQEGFRITNAPILTLQDRPASHFKTILDEEERTHWQVDIKTGWLSTLDYAKLLGRASLGVSLHTSSSGVYLPMKVVDMFHAGLPVVGWNRFEAWPELVTEGVNGRGFGSPEELASHFTDLFGHASKLGNLRRGAQKESLRRWD